MSHLIALEIEEDQLLVAVAQTVARRIKIERTFYIKLKEDDSDQENGERLRKWLSSHGVHRADAIAVVSRASAEIRELTIPPAPDNELPDLVKFKARSDFGSLTDNWSLDFVPFKGDPDQPRQVLAAAISPELTAQISTVAEAAGIRLKHIVFRPYAAVDLLSTRLADDKCRIIVDETGDQVDVSFTQGSHLIATRTVRVSADQNLEQKVDQLIREIRRTVASRASREDAQSPQEILICGGNLANAELLETKFTEQLKIETHFVEPFQLVTTDRAFERPEKTQSFTALLGALLQHVSDHPHDIDFLNPRKTVSGKKDLSRVYRIGGIVAAALLLIALIGWWMLSSQASEIKKLSAQLEAQTAKNEDETVEQILLEVEQLDSFKQSTFNWLDEMYEISKAAKTPDDFIVDSFDISFKKNVPTLVMNGRVTDSKTETTIRRDLIDRPYLQVAPNNAGKSGDPDYPEKFSYSIHMSVPGIGQVNAETNRLAIEYRNQRANPEPLSAADSSADSDTTDQ